VKELVMTDVDNSVTNDVMMNEGIRISRYPDGDFNGPGLRSHWEYRHFVNAENSDGRLGVRTVRAKDGLEDNGTGWHYHINELHITYILSGWGEMEGVGTGVFRLNAGDFLHIKSGTPHQELRTSPGFEALTIQIPAKMETVAIDPPT
jgi:quercetin dioxygenase-like cupin family protein